MQLTTLVINLDRASDRMREMERQLSGHGIEYRRISAIDGSKLDESVPEYDLMGYRIRIGKLPNMSEIGCYLSHLNAMEALLESEATHALILEDDAVLPDDFNTLLDEVLAERGCWDILRLSSSRKGKYLQIRELTAGRKIAINTRVLKNTAGYIVNRHAAQRCLDSLLPMRRPYDVALDRDWTMGLRTACVVPLPINSGHMPGQIPQSRRTRIWRSTSFHLLHALDHVCRRVYRYLVYRANR